MNFDLKRFSQMADDEILVLFYRMEQEGSLRQAFYDGHISTPWEFLNYVRHQRLFGGALFLETTPAACFWVSDISGNMAFFHYWCYKVIWGKGVNDAAKAALTYLATNTHLTGLCGRTPARHKLAVRALKRGGFKIMCEMPEAILMHDGTLDTAIVSFFDLKPLKEGT